MVNLRKIDLNLLLVFDTVYSTGSNTKAAEKLGVTQSAVSNALRRLREHLDDPLFERHGHEFVPTPQAERLAPSISDALSIMSAALDTGDQFEPETSDRVFTLAIPDSVEMLLMPPLIKLINDRDYRISIRVRPLFGLDVEKTIADPHYDLVFVQNPVHGEHLNSAFLFEDDVCIVCRADHPVYGDAKTFGLEDMEKIQLITLDEDLRLRTHVEQEMREKGIKRRISCTVARLWSLPHLVASTDGFAPLPRSMAKILAERYNLKLFDFPIDRPSHQWHMAWHDSKEAEAAHRWLRQEVKRIIAAG